MALYLYMQKKNSLPWFNLFFGLHTAQYMESKKAVKMEKAWERL